MEIVNLTPHPINIILAGETITFLSEGSIRLEENRKLEGYINNIPIYQKTFGSAELPAIKYGTIYIVSALVAGTFPDREDFLVPDEMVRDEKGNIIGCGSLCRLQPIKRSFFQ